MTTGQREQKHRQSIVQLVKPSGPFNPQSFSHLSELAERCAIEAVANGFQWLSVDQIRKPLRSLKDAQFARQVAIHLMAVELEVEQRHIARMQGRQRTSIHFAIRAVERRLEDEYFTAAYEQMAAHAVAEYTLSIDRDAA